MERSFNSLCFDGLCSNRYFFNRPTETSTFPSTSDCLGRIQAQYFKFLIPSLHFHNLPFQYGCDSGHAEAVPGGVDDEANH